MSDIINQIAEAIEAEIHEAWTESDADFNRGMEYSVSIVKAVDIRTDSDTISRESALAEFKDGRDVYDIMESIEQLPSAQPNGDTISRRAAIDAVWNNNITRDEIMAELERLPSAPDSRQRGEWVEIKDYNGDVHYQCDQCGNEFILIDGTPKENNYNFCPNCGADMRGDKNG